MNRILLIDDDVKLGRLLTDYFQQYDLALSTATSPSKGLTQLQRSPADLLILDIMLPEMDGFELCRTIRSQPQCYGQLPIIMLTARGEVTDRIVGLELGADDYLAKPFEPRELVARIQNVLRRSREANNAFSLNNDGKCLKADGLQLDQAKQSVVLDGGELELTTMEYQLLRLLMLSPGKTFHRDELINQLRGISADLYSRAVDTLVSRLRHKLNDGGKAPRFIKTVWGRGYTFIGEVR